MILRLQEDGNNLLNSLVELVYFMRGSVGYEEMLRRTPAERNLMKDFIIKRLESQKNTPHPVF